MAQLETEVPELADTLEVARTMNRELMGEINRTVTGNESRRPGPEGGADGHRNCVIRRSHRCRATISTFLFHYKRTLDRVHRHDVKRVGHRHRLPK